MSRPRSPHADPPSSSGPTLGYILLGLVLSGAAGLIDEIAWIRRSSLVFGSTTHALSTVLMVFFLGLAIGGAVSGRLSERVRRPLLVCALLEVALAILVVLTPLAFDMVEGLYGGLYRSLPAGSPLLWGARAGLIAILLLPPTLLMGATLPLFARQFVRTADRIGFSIAGLYALNTLGAALGCALAGFGLLPAIGVRGSLWAAAALNLIAAAIMVSARAAAVEPVAPARGAARGAARATGPVPASVFRTVALLLFATGFVALGEEVLWTRFLAPIVGGTVRTYTLTLTLVLVGIVLGSALATRLADRARARVFVLGLLQVASALLVWFLLFLPPAWWRSLGGELPTAALLLLPPAVLPGASFPLAVRMVVTTPAWAGLGLGTMLAINTLGGIAGALVIGFFVLPGFGLEAGARLCTGLSLAAGILAWIGLERSAGPAPRPAPRPVPRLILAAAAIAVWLAIPGLTGTRVPADFLADRSLLVAMREGVESNVAVVRRSAGGIALEIDRWWQGQDRKTHQVIAAHLPMLVHPRPRTVLLVGVGAGQTPERFAMYDIERLDCADIEPRVFDVVRAHFPSAWMNDRRVTLLPVDGRNHLVHTDARYDVISLEVGQLFRPGAAGFYTLDFYRRARARLAPGGILSQFVPLPFLSADELRGVVATFLDAFPGATLWYNTSELLLIGPESGSVRLGRERITEVLADSAIARDLEFSPWGGSDAWFSRPEVEAGAFLCGPQGLAALSRGGTIYRDDPSRLEYEVARPKEDDRREIATLPLVRAHLDPIESVAPWIPPDLASAAAAVREENLREVIAAAYLRSVDPARDRNDLVRVEALVRQALAAQPRNAMANRILGDALLLQGRTGDAEKAYRQALAISEGDARAHAGLALLALTTGRLPEATSHYRVALALEENADWRNNLGSALAQTGDVAGALAEFERAVELRPDFVDARRNADQARAVLASGYQNPARGRTESDSI